MPKFKEGCRVVIMQYSAYRGKYTDEVGTIESVFMREKAPIFGVRLDSHTNESSSKGLFWFEANHLKRLKNEREEIIMFNNYIVAEVQFIDNPNTGNFFYALYDGSIQANDTVVVATGHHGFALAVVVDIHQTEDKKKEVKFGREVVCRVDFSDYNNRREAVKKATELKRDMEKRMREAQELALYEALAERDPALKKMLEEYKSLMEECQ